MTSSFDSLSSRQTRGRPLVHESTRPPAQAKPLTVLPTDRIRTLLVATCGWPTDAPAPTRKRVAKR